MSGPISREVRDAYANLIKAGTSKRPSKDTEVIYISRATAEAYLHRSKKAQCGVELEIGTRLKSDFNLSNIAFIFFTDETMLWNDRGGGVYKFEIHVLVRQLIRLCNVISQASNGRWTIVN
jgi:hypothetical protein